MIEELVALQDYFGCDNLGTVNPLVLRMALAEGRPDWLRGKRKLHDLPNWNGKLTENLIVHYPSIQLPRDVATRITWIVENIQRQWRMDTQGFFFEDSRDAIHFKLVWS